jgi:hypothetical protein
MALVTLLFLSGVYWLWKHAGFSTESKHTNGD